MAATGLTGDLGESYLHIALNKVAVNTLNNSAIRLELQREASRRKIRNLRWYHNGLINLNNTQTASDDNIDNALQNNKNDAFTLSVYNRPCRN